MSQVVLDASVALAWLFEDDATGYAVRALDELRGLEILVPAVWPLEIANALVAVGRRRLLPAEKEESYLAALLALPLTVEPAEPLRSWTNILAVARRFGLTSYDAAYLELAARTRSPLATLDAALRRAARKEGLGFLF
jgi:predicted nucleic acid-binding protein